MSDNPKEKRQELANRLDSVADELAPGGPPDQAANRVLGAIALRTAAAILRKGF